MQAAFWEIYQSGFRSSSLETIFSNAGVTKGALYHHFPGKTALGYAVVEEIIRPLIYQFWIHPLEKSEDPLQALSSLGIPEEGQLSSLLCQLGCPLNNLSQEMSGLDEGFRKRLVEIFDMWRHSLTEVLLRGQERGQVRPDIDPEGSAAFLVAALEGVIGLAKNTQSPEVFEACRREFQRYLDTLRPAT